MSDSGILNERVRITRRGYAHGAAGEIIGIYSTKKGPSYRVKIFYGESPFVQSLKRDEFDVCKPWNILQTQLEVSK